MAAPVDPTAAAVLDSSPINGEDSPASDDLKFGFQRPEMNTSPLAGTVGLYDCHLFLCYKNPESWPARVEGHDADLLPRFLAAALKSRKSDIPRNVLLTVCEGREDSEFLDGDVLIFPDMIKYRGLTHSEVDNFVEEVLVCGKQWLSGRDALLVGSHIFVCSHGSRDKRCGVCGPVLVKKLEEEIELRGLKDRVFVCPCSHVGGHKYAGNLIIFSSNHEGEVMGHWYGYVTPDDVSALLDQHIGKGEIIDRLWRGQMGMSDEEQKKVHEHRLQQNGEEVQTNGIDTIGSEKLLQEDNSKVSKSKDVASCCQGANGFSCCMEQKVEDKEAGAGSADKPIQSKTYLDGINTWMKRLDQGDALVALGVIGVVTSVAVAYSIYRRSG